MLKKLVKYGNSNALILDKPILELLNIAEGSIVKIKTDGKSIVISPHTSEVNENYISPTITPHNGLQNAAIQEMAENMYKNLDPEKKAENTQQLEGIHSRYSEALKKLHENADYMQQLKAMTTEKYKGNSYSPQFIKESEELRNKYAPEISQIEQEMRKISTPKEQFSTQFSQLLKEEFAHFFKKHTSSMEKLTKIISENIDYQHESVLLAEKYAINKNSKEYLDAVTELKYKYAPEFRELDEELKSIYLKFSSKE